MSKPRFELPGYEIIEPLGEGGMAVVWKARQVSLDRMVAIKILMPEWRQDADAMDRFRKEAMAAAKLKHSGIIQVFDAGETADAVYFVMEYVQGYTVGQRIHKRGALAEETALDITLGVAAALNYAWDTAKMIHCDIKPDNIMIDHDGTVKLADLGLARALGPTTSNKIEEYIVGTPNYLSPEQARGESNLDCGTDVYALGASLYHMVTGRLPFGDTPGTAPLERQQTDFLLDPLDLNPNLTPALGALIERMMVKDRQLRPNSWQKVIAEVQEVREGFLPPGDLPPAGASTVLRGAWRTANPGKRRPAMASKKNVVTYSADTQAPQPEGKLSAPHTPAHTRRPRNWGVLVSQIIIIGSLLIIGAGAIYIYLFLNGKLPNARHAPADRGGELRDRETRLLHPGKKPVTQMAPKTEKTHPGMAPKTTAVATPSPKPVMHPPAAVTNNVPPHDAGVGRHSVYYRRAARFFNYALDIYRQYTGRMTIPVVERIETACRQAIADFNTCREAQTDKANVARLVERCNQLIADAQFSGRVANAAGASAVNLPPLPSMDLSAEPPPEVAPNPAVQVASPEQPTPSPVAPPPPTPAAPPKPAVQPATVDEAALTTAWKAKPAARTAIMDEFRDLISLYAPDADVGTQNLLLYDRIAYGMSALEAARTFGATLDDMQPLQSPLFPEGHYFLHDVAIAPQEGFNHLILVVDRADHVVAVQMMTEQPADTELRLPASLFQSRWQCYDFLRTMVKVKGEWKIAYRVALVGKLARLDCELAADDPAAPLGLGAPRARTYLYFPQALAARMLERIETP